MRSHTYTEHCLRANSSIERHGGFRPLPRPMLPSGRPSISDSGPVIRRRQWICSPHQHQSSHGLSTPSQPSSLFVQMPLQSMVDSLPHRPRGTLQAGGLLRGTASGLPLSTCGLHASPGLARRPKTGHNSRRRSHCQTGAWLGLVFVR